ncbi:hypothetical protein J437_LFUL002771, partial [Ladona fulva]
GRKTESIENQHDVCSTKTVRRNASRKVAAESPYHEVSQSFDKRPALRERTNLSTSRLSTANTSLKERCKGKPRKSENSSPKELLVTPKERARQRQPAKVSSKTPSPKENSFRREVREKGTSKLGNTPKDCFVSPKVKGRRASVSSNNSTLANSSLRKRCVYMSTIPEDKDVKDKEELYEFVVDKNEPPSRRRRKRTVKNSRKPVGFPRRRNNSETSCSSASSHFSSFASSTGSSVLKPVKNGAAKKKNQCVSFCTSISSTCSSVAGIKPPATGGVKQHLVPILDSSSNPKCDIAASFSAIPTSTPMVATPTRKDVTVPVNRSINPSSIEFPTLEDSEFNHVAGDSLTIIPPHTTIQNPLPPETPTKNSFGNSSIWSERPSMSLGLANLHSTPCKARSGSDTSNCQQLDETNCNKENCFGFSSDEEEAEMHMISPLRLSPHSHAHRHTLLSPPKAPSRYSPQTVKKMLALRENGNLLNVNSSTANNHKRKLKFQERKRGEPAKKVGRRGAKKTEAESKENIVSAFKAVQEKVNESSSDHQLGTPVQPAEELTLKMSIVCGNTKIKLFDYLKKRPPRRSYERPLKKNKKVAGGGLCLISDDEDDPLVDVEKKEEEVVEKKKKPPSHHPRRKATVSQKMEKELDHWASLMNSQFGEVEGFDLCIDKKFE